MNNLEEILQSALHTEGRVLYREEIIVKILSIHHNNLNHFKLDGLSW